MSGSYEELMAAFSGAPVSQLKGTDKEREAAFRSRIDGETNPPRGLRNPEPAGLPSVVTIAELQGRK